MLFMLFLVVLLFFVVLLRFAVVFMLVLLLVVVVGSVFGVGGGHVIVSVLSGDVVSVVGIVVTHWG